MAAYHHSILDTISEPSALFKGNHEEILAVSEIEKGKYLIVVYKEVSRKDGFIITTFISSKVKSIERREKLWP